MRVNTRTDRYTIDKVADWSTDRPTGQLVNQPNDRTTDQHSYEHTSVHPTKESLSYGKCAKRKIRNYKYLFSFAYIKKYR